jgi:hypothetical protein
VTDQRQNVINGRRAPQEGESCKCGRPAVLVYVFPDDTRPGEVREVPYCGIPDGGAR